jgi:hypothetical protein
MLDRKAIFMKKSKQGEGSHQAVVGRTATNKKMLCPAKTG